MRLNELIDKLDLEITVGTKDMNIDVKNCYTSDILSDVMSNAKEGSLWITAHTHTNIIAVAVMRSLCALIITNKKQPEVDTLKKAGLEQIPLLRTDHTSFDISGMLYELGIRG